jgi:hypothetical protein
MKSNADNRPPALLDLGDGSWHYNYNIQEVQVVAGFGEERTAFGYDTVHILGAPEYDKLVKAVISEHYSLEEEISLINKYNAFVAGLSTDPADKEKYETYWTKVNGFKTMIREDLRALGLMEPESDKA